MKNKIIKKIIFVLLISMLLTSTSSNVFCITEAPNDNPLDFDALNNPTDFSSDTLQLTNNPPTELNSHSTPWIDNPYDYFPHVGGNRPDFFQNPFLEPYVSNGGEIIKLSNLFENYFLDGYNPESLIRKTKQNKVEFILAFYEAAEPTILNEWLSSLNIDITSKLPSINAITVNIPIDLAFAPSSTIINDIKSKPFVKYLEPNYYCTSTYIPDDTEWINQWGPQLIGMETAWDTQLGSIDITVAIIDSGIDYTHPDLIANYLPIGYDWINNDDDPMDDHGHGTHCAGIVAASINNALGIAGIANVSFFAEKFLGWDNYGSYADAASAIIHAVDMGADILSNSWGGYGISQVLADAVQYALDNDVMVIAAAMNDATNMEPYPASLPGVIAVSATDVNDDIASFSNYGDWIDIAAPGVGILSTYPGESYVSWDGTSMATPHVAGLAALLISQYPSYTTSQIEQLIYNSAIDFGDVGFDIYYGWGRIDASTAINGFQDHDVRANIQVPSIIPADLSTMIIGQVQNLGLEIEYNVEATLYIDGFSVYSETIPELLNGEKYEFYYDFYPGGEGIYSIFFEVEAVPGETVISNNVVYKDISAVMKQINPSIGDKMGYNGFDYIHADYSPFYLNFEVVGIISETEYEVLMTYFDFESKGEYSYYYILNPYTRELDGKWEAFPYWINATTLDIGSYVDIFTLNNQEGLVIGETAFDYYGVMIDAWVVEWVYDDMYDTLLFSKGDGILLEVTIPGYGSYFNMIYSNIDFETWYVHNIRGAIVPVYPTVNTPTTVEILIHNTGAYDELINGFLDINGYTYDIIDLYLMPDDYIYLSFDWTPMLEGLYTISLVLDPVTEEYFIDDNIAELIVEVVSEQMLGYIEVYAYDDMTMLPIEYAELYVYDEEWSFVDYGYTDADGFYNVTDLTVGEYYVEIYKEGYEYAAQFVYIDYLGEAEFLYFYLIPYSVGESYIEVYVFDSMTLEPIYDVYLDLYENGNYRDYGSTDIDGFYNFTELGPSNYEIYTYKQGYLYQMQQVIIDYDGQGVVVYYYLDLVTYGDSFIETYVYDSVTFDGIMYASIYVYDEYYNFVEYGYTDEYGFYNITDLGVGGFYVDVYTDGYYGQSQYVYIDYDGKAEYLYFYLDPTSIPGNSMIEVYVYDSYTLEAIPYAYVYVYDEFWNYVSMNYTDDYGSCLISDLSVGGYYIEVYADGYFWQTQYAYIDYDGELEYLYFYLEPTSIPGEGYIEAYVYDADTFNPIVSANIALFDEFYNYLYDDYTDVNGFFNFTDLGVGGYYVEVHKYEYIYQTQYAYIDYDGEAEYLYFYMPPFSEGESYIEVYTIDSMTLEPIEGTYLTLNELGSYRIEANADMNGFYNFTGLGISSYDVSAWWINYDYQIEYVTIDWDGQGVSIYFYMEPLTYGNSYIEVYVYNGITYEPVFEASVHVYNDNWDYVDFGYTDEYGYYLVDNLGTGGFYLEVEAQGYHWESQYTYISYDGEGVAVYFYLTAIYREFYIVTPTYGEVIEGGSVLITYTADNLYDVYLVDIFVNGEFISSIMNEPDLPLVLVPVFQEGTNVIELVGYFFDGAITSDTVEIETINLAPIINVDVGDYLYMRVDQLDAPKYHFFYFYFEEWISTYEINTSIIVERYENDVLYEYSEYWLVINVLNAYIPESDMWWLYQKFIFFAAVDCPQTTGDYANYGDIFSMWYWNDLFAIEDSTYYDTYEVWVAYNMYGDIIAIEKNTALVLYYESTDYFIMYIIDTSLIKHQFSIIEPYSSEDVKGGSVYVQFEASELYDLAYIDVYVNDVYVTTVDNYGNSDLIVPVFQNGTNTIKLIGWWYDGQSAEAEVTFESYYVIPIALINPGDYWNWRFTDWYYMYYYDFNFTFEYWVSDFEIYTLLTVHRHDGYNTISLDYYWLVINTLNGYITDSDMWWIYNHFYFFSGLDSPYTTGEWASYGDKAAFWRWNDLITLGDETFWNMYEVWDGFSDLGYFNAYFEKWNSYLVYYDEGGYITGELMETNIIQPPDTTPPVVTDTPDKFVEFGSINNYIEWTATDALSDYYFIVKDGEYIEEGTWQSNVPISINIDGLAIGVYEYIIIFVDIAGNYGWDTVFVTVGDITVPIIIGPDDLTYEGCTTGNQLTWIAWDYNPYGFAILLDGVELINGSWVNDFPVNLNVDGLEPGVHEYTIIFEDLYGNAMSDTVFVTVIDTVAPIIPLPPDDIELNPGRNDAKMGFEIEWVAYDCFAEYYELYLEDELISTGGWQSGIPIYLYMVIFIPGEYEFVIELYDSSGNMISDSVIVRIGKVGRVDSFTSYLSILVLLGVAVIYKLAKRRRKKIIN